MIMLKQNSRMIVMVQSGSSILPLVKTGQIHKIHGLLGTPNSYLLEYTVRSNE